MEPNPALSSAPGKDPDSPQFTRGLGLFDSTMVVVGVMIGSGIFIVPADMSRLIGSAGWLLVAWAIAGVLTIFGALSYGTGGCDAARRWHVHLSARVFFPHCGAFFMVPVYAALRRPQAPQSAPRLVQE